MNDVKVKENQQIGDYQRYVFRKSIFLVILLALTIMAGLAAIALGSSKLPLGDVLRTIFGGGSKKENVIVLGIRLPRTCTAIISGFAFGIVGCVMQSILRNPMASASTIGVSQGAAFGAAFAIIVLGAGIESGVSATVINVTNPAVVSLCAFGGAMISTGFILALSAGRRLSPGTLVLSGVALGALFTGATTLIEYFADDVEVAAVVYWTFGDIGGTFWNDIILMAVVTAGAFLYFMFNRWNYTAIQSGEDTAKSLGVNTKSLLLVGMVVCSFTAAIIVSNIGTINFIGLIAPHIVRKFVGSDYRFLLPASGLAGSLLLLLADTVSRLVVAPIILPIGAISSFIGAPFFLFIVIKEGKRR